MGIKVLLNDEELRRVCADLRICVPPIKFRETPDELVYGTASRHTRSIEIRVGLNEYRQRGLRHVKSQVNRTLLHELRHIHQYNHWGELNKLDMEEDCRAYENTASVNYSLVQRITRKAIVAAGLRLV